MPGFGVSLFIAVWIVGGQSATTSPLLHFSGPPLVTITSWFRKNMKKYRAQIDTNWSLAKPAVFMDSFIQEMRKPADSPASSSGRLGFAVAHPKAPLMRVPHPCSSSAASTNTVALIQTQKQSIRKVWQEADATWNNSAYPCKSTFSLKHWSLLACSLFSYWHDFCSVPSPVTI